MKRFIARKRVNYNKIKMVLILIIILVSTMLSIKIFKGSPNIDIANNLISDSLNYSNDLSFLDIINFNLSGPETILKSTFSGVEMAEDIKKVYSDNNDNKENNDKVNDSKKEPILYIYNTHQTEEYVSSSLANYNITPTVYMAGNILKQELEKYNVYSVVEDENIKTVLNEHGWSYKDSYSASRLWLERTKERYPTIKYYLDLHRDSVSLTANINNKSYARIMYVLGMNYDGYENNEALMVKLNEYTKEKYPGLTRDILYAKKNTFNQDFSGNVFLIEVGGNNNNFNEVYNSVLALAEIIGNVVGSDN